MARKSKGEACCPPAGKSITCCNVESLVSIDERGQMVLPKELRDRANIRPGDKLAVISWKREDEVCCLVLIKADVFAEMIKGVLGPMLSDLNVAGTRT